MEIMTGSLYFVSDDFFAKIQDPYLKINYKDTKRPHYFAFKDSKTGLYWLVPCSSKIEKFEHLIQKKQEQHKPTDTIKIVKIFDRKTVLLFQDMFPIIAAYIDGQYIKGGQPVRIAVRYGQASRLKTKVLNMAKKKCPIMKPFAPPLRGKRGRLKRS